ncbi:MAG: hypothetical protein QOJ40_1917, partial [Verrucomicrobiota bacterium]
RKLIAPGAVLGFCAFATISRATAGLPTPAVAQATNVSQLRALVSQEHGIPCQVRMEGVVVWASPVQDQLILQDAFGAMQIVMDLRARPPLQPGHRVRLEGGCLAGSGMLKEALVDNDGLHSLVEKAGVVYLGAGRHPIRADWFNGPDRFELGVEYAGPGLPRQKISDRALFRVDSTGGAIHLVNGLDYRCYEGHWDDMPDFQRLAAAKTGAIANFNLGARTRDEDVGLQFAGLIEVPRDGLYTFWTKSDDGSRLFVGESSLRLTELGPGPRPVARRIFPGQTLSEKEEGQWAEVEGTVTSLHVDLSGALQVEVASGTNHLCLDVQGSHDAPALFSRIRATGICRSTGPANNRGVASRLMVPDSKQIELLAAPPNPLSRKINQVTQVLHLANAGQRILGPIHLEGLVLAASPSRGLLTFQDDSGAALLETDLHGRKIEPGQKIVLEGNCIVGGTRLILGNPALVDNDGLHAMMEKAGAVFLNAGKHSIRLCWFNHLGPSGLEVYYQGPGLPRQKIPDSALFRPALDPASNALRWTNGVDYQCYENELAAPKSDEAGWFRAPNSNLLAPVQQGSTANFDLAVASRPENVGLEFNGSVNVTRDGLYTFSTISDDGSLLFIDEQPPRLDVTGTSALPPPHPIAARQILREEEQDRWSQVEGTVTFASEGSEALELELRSGAGRMRIQVADGSGSSPLLLLNSRIRAVGICQNTYTTDGQKVAGGMLTPSMKQIESLEVDPAHWLTYPVLSIGSLALTNFPNTSEPIVHVRGSVVSGTSNGSIVLEDATGRILMNTTQPPMWKQAGKVEALGRWGRARTNVILRSGFYREIADIAKADPKTPPLLTTVGQIKRLSREEAERGYPVKIQGVITAPQIGGFFIQDATWAIYVRLGDPASMDVPGVGEYWEVEGVTFAEFAPNIRAHRIVRLGTGTLPEPLRPTWDQLINGSLDTQYVEVQGIVTAVDSDGIALLTRAGTIKVQIPDADPQTLKQYESALIRVRGCVIPGRDLTTQQVELGRMRLANFSVSVDEPVPADLFATPLKRASDLLLFDPRAGAIQRVKIAGQILSEHRGEYFLMQNTNGLRFVPKTPIKLRAGDLVEVVGFPELGGPSPVLREAVVRQTGHSSLPSPRLLPENALVGRQYDATLIRVQSRLSGLSINRSDQVLELQTGTRGFVARLDTSRGSVRDISPGSLLELTGVYAGQGGDRAAGRDIDSFELLLNFPSDIKVLERPSWWTIRHTLAVVGSMALVILAASVWISLLHRRVEERSRQLTAEIGRRERTERQRALEEERSRIAQDLHDDLGATLTQIRFLSALESRDALLPQTSRDRMGQVSEKSREMVTSLDEIVWAVNPANDSLPSLATYLCQFAEEFLRATPISCRLDVDDALPQAALTSEIRHNLYLAVREALNNIAKHSEATEVWLRIQSGPHHLRISIEDNGRGFSYLSNASTGEGLANMRRRLEKISGTFECETQPGSGTVCRISLPLKSPLPNLAV